MTTVKRVPFFKMLCVCLIPFLIFPQLVSCASPRPLHPTNTTRDNAIADYYGLTVAVLDFDNNTEIGQAGDIMQ